MQTFAYTAARGGKEQSAQRARAVVKESQFICCSCGVRNHRRADCFMKTKDEGWSKCTQEPRQVFIVSMGMEHEK